MHGLGNDFIVVDGRHTVLKDPEIISVKMCDRHTGVGADGLIIVTLSEKADLGMRIFNSDGSEAEMCGNGVRCFAKYAYDEALVRKRSFTVDTLAGIIQPRLVLTDDGLVKSVAVDMGEPVLDPREIPVEARGNSFLDRTVSINDEDISLSAIGMGVPHTVLFVEEFDDEDYLRRTGQAIENHSLFPCKTNVNFVKVLNRGNIEVRTWERGAGRTLACGTGCCSAVVAASLLGKTERVVDVTLALGTLRIEWQEDGRVMMEGPAETICSGRWLK